MHLFGKNYQFKSDGDKTIFLIDGKDGSEYKGLSFYKYYALNENSVDALTNLYAYATHPCQLNDPLDCADELIDFDDLDCARILSGEMYSDIKASYNKERDILEFEKAAYRTYLYLKMGIFCLTKSWDNISMWSAYTNHTGFCLEFDVFSFPFNCWGPFPINYQRELSSFSLKEATLPIATLVQTNVKLNCWEHEQEWRILIQGPEEFYMEPFGERATLFKNAFPDYHNRKFKYPLRSLKSVCLGNNFFNGVHCVITDYEFEYVAYNKLQNKVLSFLACTKVPVFQLVCNGLHVEKLPIEITQIRKNAYIINN